MEGDGGRYEERWGDMWRCGEVRRGAARCGGVRRGAARRGDLLLGGGELLREDAGLLAHGRVGGAALGHLRDRGRWGR